MARKSRKQKKRRTRRKRGGLTPKQTKQCEAAGIPGFPPAKCQEYLTTKKKKDKVIIELSEAAKNKPSKAIPCKDDDTATYGKNKKGNCKNLREKQAFIDKVCKDQAGQHCIKTCGTCDKKICTINGGRRTRSRRGKGDKPKGAQPKCPEGESWDGKKCAPLDVAISVTTLPLPTYDDSTGKWSKGGKRRRRRRKSRRKSKRKSRRKSKHKRR